MDDNNEPKISKNKTEEALISSLVAKNFAQIYPISHFSINTYEQDMIAVENDRTN